MHSVTTQNEPETLPYSLPLELTVTDPEVIAELNAKQEGPERDDYALGALRLGVLAFKQARGQIDAGSLRHEGERLLGDVQMGLTKPADIKEMPYLVHSPRWGLGFQKTAQERGAVCYLRFPGHPSENFTDMWEFMVRELGAGVEVVPGKVGK